MSRQIVEGLMGTVPEIRTVVLKTRDVRVQIKQEVCETKQSSIPTANQAIQST